MQQTDLASDFFSLFGLPVSFEINIAVLTEHYRELQRAVHPDRFANASEAERRLSMQMATRVNEGYRLLRDPLARGRYLLELKGVEFNDAETSMDGQFLMEQMELRERLTEISDSNEPELELRRLKQDVAAREKELTEQMGELLKGDELEALQQAKDLTRKLQFFRKLDEEVDDLEEDLAAS